MAEMVAVRHKSQSEDVDPGIVPRAFLEKYGKDKGLVEVKDQSAAEAASTPEPPAAAEPAKRGR